MEGDFSCVGDLRKTGNSGQQRTTNQIPGNRVLPLNEDSDPNL